MREVIKFILFVVGILGIIAGILRLFFVDAYQVGGYGMIPTLMPGETFFAWRKANIEFGDVVICDHPKHPGAQVIGRIIGRANHRISSGRGGTLLVNGQAPDIDIRGQHRFVNPQTNHPETLIYTWEKLGDAEYGTARSLRFEFNIHPVIVQPGRLYLLSDFRSYPREDSRAFGTVAESSCKGVVFMRYKPVEGAPGPAHGWFDIIE